MKMLIPSKKGQAAIEYLMTYGWALLAIAAILGILYLLTQPQLNMQQCTTQAGFVCNDPPPQIVRDSSSTPKNQTYIIFKLYNQNPSPIVVTSALCTIVPLSEAKKTDAVTFSKNVTIASGGSQEFRNKIPTNDLGDAGIPCKDKNGNILTMTKDQSFRGYVIFWYHYANAIDTSINQTVVANVVGPVLEK